MGWEGVGGRTRWDQALEQQVLPTLSHSGLNFSIWDKGRGCNLLI